VTSVAEPLGAKVAGFTVLGLLLLAGVAWGGVYLYAGDEAPRNAKVEGVSISGLAPAAAETKLRAELESRSHQPISVSYGDGRMVGVDPQQAGLSIDYPASIREAGGGSGLDLRRMWDVVTGGGDHRAEVDVDQSRMQVTLDQLGSGFRQPPREGTVSFKDGRAVPVYGEPGLVVSRTATQRLLEQRFLHGGSQKLPTEVQQPGVSDGEVRRALAEFAKPAMSGPVTLVLAGEKVVAQPRLFAAGLSMEEVDGKLQPRVDGELLLEGLRPVMRTFGRAPENARFEIRAGKPRVVPAKVGVQVDPAEIERRFAAVAVRQGAQRRLMLAGKAIQPTFTTADARALRITEQVSTFTTRFPSSDDRNGNLSQAARKLDGTVLRPGETFSLNDDVGNLGGGVSDIATPVFNAVYLAGLKDVEHSPPRVHVDGDPAGREATLRWPSVDLKFTNTTPFGLLIKADVRRPTTGQQGTVTVSTYSTKRWRITSTEGPRTNVTKPRVRYVRGPGCEATRGTPGFSVDVVRAFHALGSGKVLRKEKFHTDYVAGDTVRCAAQPKARPKPRN
jgi:vancomycin resistance protein YoaR